MATLDPTILVTGASGQLGRLVIDPLLIRAPPSRAMVGGRAPDTGNDLASLDRRRRHDAPPRPATLHAAFTRGARLLLVSSSEIGKRVPQHRNVIEAAGRTGVGLIAYTSLLRADSSLMGLARDHRATEALLAESGVPFVVLRNGWYTENLMGAVPVAVERGAVLGSAGNGRIAAAARADQAAAAAAVLTSSETEAGKTYELAGDDSFTLTELAAEIARQSGTAVVYQELPEPDYRAVLERAGLPEPLAAVFAESDAGASQGGLFDEGRQLSALIGRPTTTLARSVEEVLRQ